MGKYLLAISCFCLIGTIPSSPVDRPKDEGTNLRTIESIFKGRCLAYQDMKPGLFPPSKRKDCNKLWDIFKSSFAFKDACEITLDNYEEYSKEAEHDVDTTNRVMLWNGKVFPFVEKYSLYKGKYILVRNILAVYPVLDFDVWCGTKDGSGINFVSCPQLSKCPERATTSFWEHVSKKFALNAKGEVHLMLNASSDLAFREESIFGRMELPSLEAKRTPKLKALLVRNLDEKPKETCKAGSLLRLKKLVEDKKMAFECLENDREVLLFQCTLDKEKKECSSILVI